MYISPQALVLATALSSGIYLLLSIVGYLLQTRRPPNFPPGPPTMLGLGNLHQLPARMPFLKFHEWFENYGDIIGLKMGHKNVVVLRNPNHVRELFSKRARRYSDRQYCRVPCEYVAKLPDQHIVFVQNNSFLTKWRTALRQMTGPKGLMKAEASISAIADRFAYDLLQSRLMDEL